MNCNCDSKRVCFVLKNFVPVEASSYQYPTALIVCVT